MASYYSYIKVEDEEGTFYQFLTNHGLAYTVYFLLDEYSTFVNDFPLLLKKGYSFGFRKQQVNNLKKGNIYDPLVFATIHKIATDFFEEKGIETVLLYHCDISDNKQSNRNKLFNIWETKAAGKPSICKYSVEVELQQKMFYLGFISLNSNPLLNDIKLEFEKFAYFIIQPKP